MRILLIPGEFPPYIFGGGGISMYHLSRGLVGRGHKVYVVALGFSEKPMGGLYGGVTVKRVNDNLVIVRVFIPKHIYPRHKVFQLYSKNIIDKLVEKVDIIHLNTGLYHPFIRDVIKRSKKPSVVTIHGDPVIDNKISMISPFTSIRDVTYHVAFLLDGVLSLKYEVAELHPVFVSKYLAQSISSYIPVTKFKVIYNGIDFDFIYSSLRKPTVCRLIDFIQKFSEKGYKILTYPARLYPIKNNAFLLYVTKKLLKIGHRVKTIFVGEGPLKIRLESMSKRLQVDQHIIMADKLPYETVMKILSVSHVVPFQSLQEACRLTLIEALYIGKPVVTFNLPYARELIDLGIEGIYTANNPRHFIEVLDSLLSQIDITNENQISLGIREKIAKLFSVKLMTDQYEQLYFDLIK